MKSTGVTRAVDELGRIVIPVEIRSTLDIEVGDSIAFYIDIEKEQIMLKAYTGDTCVFCRHYADQMHRFKGKLICDSCMDETKTSNPSNSNHIINEILLKYPVIQKQESITVGVKQQGLSKRDVNAETGSNGSPKRRKRTETMQEVIQLISANPSLKQTEIASIMGVTAVYVSQIVKDLKMSGTWQAIKQTASTRENDHKK